MSRVIEWIYDKQWAITPNMLELVTAEGQRVLEPGEFRVTVGGASPSPRSGELGAPEPVTAVFSVIA